MVLKIKDIMSSQVVTVSVDTPIDEAASIMEVKPISCVVILHHRQPVGILTERDIVREIIVAGRDPKTTPVSAIMKKSLPVVDPDDPINVVFDIIQKYGIRHLPVTRGTQLFGVVSESDVMRGFRKIELDLEQGLLSGKLSVEEFAKKRKEMLVKKTQQNTTLSSGSIDLDNLIGGGLIRGTSVAIEGPPGSGKGLLGFLFLIAGLKKEEKGIYIYMGDNVDNIQNGFRAFGVDVQEYIKKELLHFIELKPLDALTASSSVNAVKVDDPKQLIDKIKQLLHGNTNSRLVFNTLSHQVMLMDAKSLYKHVYEVTDVCRANKWSALYLVEEGINEPSNIVSIEQLLDGVIQIKYNENKNEIERRLIVKKMEGGKMVPQKYFVCQFDPAKGMIICPPIT